MRGLFGLRALQGHAAPAQRVMWLQAVLVMAILLTGWLINSRWAAGSAAFGAGVAGFNTALLCWRMPAQRVVSDPGFHLKSAYRSMVERFVGVALLLWLGLVVIHCAPLWLLVGFISGQMAWAAAGFEWFKANR